MLELCKVSLLLGYLQQPRGLAGQPTKIRVFLWGRSGGKDWVPFGKARFGISFSGGERPQGQSGNATCMSR